MEKKSKVLVYLPRRLYVQLHERQLTNHVSYLVSRLLEEFLKATDVRVSWAEMSSKAEHREYLETKLREFLFQNRLPTEPPKPPVQERTEPTYVQESPKPSLQEKSPPTYPQEPSKEVYAVSKPEIVREAPPPPPKEDSGDDLDILKAIDNLW